MVIGRSSRIDDGVATAGSVGRISTVRNATSRVNEQAWLTPLSAAESPGSGAHECLPAAAVLFGQFA